MIAGRWSKGKCQSCTPHQRLRFNIWEKEVRDKLLPEAVVAGVRSASRRDESVRQQRADHQKYSAGRSAPSTSQPSSGGSHTSQLHSPVITVEESDGVNIDHTCFSPSSSVSVVKPSSKHHAPIVDEQHGQTAQNQPPQPEQDKPTEPETQNRYSRTEELLLENLLVTKNLTKAVENMREDLHRHIDRALARVNKEQRQAIDHMHESILDAIYLQH